MDEHQLDRDIGEIKGMLRGMNDHLNVQDARLNDHSKRLRSLERWKAWLLGIGAGVGALLSSSYYMFFNGKH